jgi:hypothetical protein
MGLAEIVFEPLLTPLGAAAATAALAAATVLVLRWRPASTPRRRVMLAVLRLGVVAAIGLMLLGPVVMWTGRIEVPGAVAVLLDSSASMAIRDVPPPPGQAGLMTRSEAVRHAFLAAAESCNDLGRRYAINPLAFGSGVRPMGSFAPVPTDPRTDIAEALAYVLAAEDAEAAAREASSTRPPAYRLAAVILVSDGRANRARGSAEQAARDLADRGLGVHTVLVGSDSPSAGVCDVAVRDLRVPARVFVGNRAEVRGTVLAVGMKGRPVTCVLSVDGVVVERRELVPAADRMAEEVVFSPRLEARGLARIRLAAEPAADELNAMNNAAEAVVRVDEGAVRVLYLDGRIRPEGKYIARVLGDADEIDLDRRILVGSAAGARPTSAGAPVTAGGDGATQADLDACDILVLGDLPASALDAATWAHAAERVVAGKLSLLVLGGQDAFGAGGWAGTPLAGVLPVTLRGDVTREPGPLRMRPAPGAALHFIFAGEAGAAAALSFDGLPPLSGASAVGPLQPTARLLAESADGKPLLAVRDFGRARVAAFMGDTTWQWVLAPSETHGADVHRRFWRQLVLWLAGRDGRPRADFWIRTDRPRYVVSDPDNSPVAEVTAHLAPTLEPAGLRSVTLSGPGTPAQAVRLEPAGGGDWRALVPLRDAGLFDLTAVAGDGAASRRAATAFVVEEQNFEWADILADGAALQRLAQAGGGTFRRLGDLSALLSDLARDLKPRYQPQECRLPLAQGRVFLALVLALLAAEWLLRRRGTA